MNGITDIEINSHVQKICIYANNLTIKFQKKIKTKSDFIFYELIFFFYFIDNAFYSINNYPVELTSNVGPYLFKTLENINRGDYQSIKDKIRHFCWDRIKVYGSIIDKYNEKFTPDFFMEAFFYLSDLIIYIKNKNEFCRWNTQALTLQDWIQKAALNDDYNKLRKLYVKEADTIIDFLFK